MTKVKICGITNIEDAKIAMELGADALGFNFYKESSRYIEPAKAQAIVRQLPPNAWFVGVFVNESRQNVDHIARLVGLDTLQFHSLEPVEMLRNWNEFQTIKAIRLREETTQEEIESYQQAADFLLFDSFSKDAYGGSGKAIDTTLLSKIDFSKAFLAGGLTAENVSEKVKAYKPFGVDVASGVEESPGKKSLAKVRSFLEAVMRASP